MVQAKVVFSALSVGFLVACTDAPPANPMCRVVKTETPAPAANAGCIVRVGNTILALTHLYSQKYDVPGGTSAGADESAQCTAHRETWEETGFNVEVGALLGVSEHGLQFYACELDDDFDGLITDFPVPSWSKTEVNGIQLVDPFVTLPNEWRYPEQLILYRDMFNVLNNKKAEPIDPTS